MPRQRNYYSRRIYAPPRGLPGAAEAVPRGVRPVAVGDRPASGDLSQHRMALEGRQGASQLSAPEGASGVGRQLGPWPLVYRLSCPAPGVSPSLQRMPDRDAFIWCVQIYGCLYTNNYVQRDRQKCQKRALKLQPNCVQTNLGKGPAGG